MVQTVRQRDVGLVRLARDGSCQITEAFPWYEALRYLIRDRDCVYGASVTRRMRTMGIRDKPIAAVAERLRPKADWIDPTRVRRPFGCFRRSALTPDSDEICCLL